MNTPRIAHTAASGPNTSKTPARYMADGTMALYISAARAKRGLAVTGEPRYLSGDWQTPNSARPSSERIKHLILCGAKEKCRGPRPMSGLHQKSVYIRACAISGSLM